MNTYHVHILNGATAIPSEDKCAVDGVLAVTGDDVLLFGSESDAMKSSANYVPVVDSPWIVPSLYSTIPAFGGGKYSYIYRAVLVGRLRAVSGVIELHDVESATIYDDDAIVELYPELDRS